MSVARTTAPHNPWRPPYTSGSREDEEQETGPEISRRERKPRGRLELGAHLCIITIKVMQTVKKILFLEGEVPSPPPAGRVSTFGVQPPVGREVRASRRGVGGSVRPGRDWSAAGDALMAAGGGSVARSGAGAAALVADGGQLASAQQTQGLAEAEGQTVPLAACGDGTGGRAGRLLTMEPGRRGGPPATPRVSGLQLSLALSHLSPQVSGELARLHPAFQRKGPGTPTSANSSAPEKPASLPPSIPPDPRSPPGRPQPQLPGEAQGERAGPRSPRTTRASGAGTEEGCPPALRDRSYLGKHFASSLLALLPLPRTAPSCPAHAGGRPGGGGNSCGRQRAGGSGCVLISRCDLTQAA